MLGTSLGSASSGDSASAGVVASPALVSEAGVGVGVCASAGSGSGVLFVMVAPFLVSSDQDASEARAAEGA